MAKGKRRLVGGTALASLGALGLALWFGLPEHRITPEALGHIRPGMTSEQVTAVLGVPPGDYTTPGAERLQAVDPDRSAFHWHRTEDWWADGITIRVYYDERGIVLFAGSTYSGVAREPLLDKLRRWLGL
jgi:hypothetical protein